MKVSIIGLGKLGAPMAAVMAHKGNTVVGVSRNALGFVSDYMTLGYGDNALVLAAND
jgi:3-hydroxyisobutyrate dehydrogenase-like beta-hydroxyacid dehydrogenase